MRKPTLRACFALLLAGCGLSYAQIITTVAGGAWWGSPTGTMPALQAPLRFPGALAMDRQGNVYIADSYNLEVMRLSPDGMLTVIAGTGSTGSPAEGAQATSAPLGSVGGVAVDAGGNVYITANGRVQKVSPAGIITTVATGGLAGNRLAMDAAGNLYMGGSGTILKVTPAGVVSTLAKGLWGPGGIAVDSAGNVFATLYNTVIKVAPDGTTTTVAQAAGGPADVAVDAGGNLYIANGFGVAKVAPGGTTTTVVGSCASTGLTCPDGDMLDIRAVLVDPNGNLYIGDVNGRRVRKVTPAGIISTVAGNGLPPFFGDGGVATQAALATPAGIALDSTGNLYIADTNNQRVRRVTPAGIISTVAGNGTEGFSGDKGPAASATLSSPTAVAVDAAGNLYIAEGGHYYNYPGRIRKVTPDGNINTIAGGGTGSGLNGGSATSLRLSMPQALLIDATGNLYLADWPDVVYKVTPGGTMTAIAAQLSSPLGLAMDTSGNL
jgi:sugar lactone lactonase YvrE